MNLLHTRAVSANMTHIPTPVWMNIRPLPQRHLNFAITRIICRQPMRNFSEHLSGLNKQQLKAVLSSSSGALQILAGPGTGKTFVAALRTAKLIQEDGIPPESIFMATFGRHPAQELRSRLNGLIGPELTGLLQLGTLHSTCCRWITHHRTPNANMWTDDMCRDTIRHIVKYHVSKDSTVPIEDIVFKVQQAVARMKVYSGSLQSQLQYIYNNSNPGIDYNTFERITLDYQGMMTNSHGLDFDDLVNGGQELVRKKPSLVSHIRHILIDEYQDTNLAQYKLIRTIAWASNSGITVVGDPDQAIYGWRFADTKNFERMCKDFPNTETINLEINYRSTASIVNFGHAIITQDEARSSRPLYASQKHHTGSLPILHKCLTLEEEANAVATSIREIHHTSDGALSYGDFAILVRYNGWKQYFSASLKRGGIPFQLLPKHSFYTNSVVRDVLAYVFLAFSPHTTPWLLRIMDNMNTIDTKTVIMIQRYALDRKTAPMSIVRQLAHDTSYNIDPQVRAQLQSLIVLLEYIKKEGRNGILPSQILEYVIQHTDFKRQLEKRVPFYIFYECWSEVQGLVKKAREFEKFDVMMANGLATPVSRYIEHVRESAKEFQLFDSKKVNIMTVHASKGLEFPVVFIPGVRDGVYPRSTKQGANHDEDRRLLYVGCTRPKSQLHLTYPKFKDAEISGEPTELSEFIERLDPVSLLKI
ncbi:P-loop containing nucleoside triphosphate hydrolase protein, partial [Rhizoctonia solani]